MTNHQQVHLPSTRNQILGKEWARLHAALCTAAVRDRKCITMQEDYPSTVGPGCWFLADSLRLHSNAKKGPISLQT